MNRWKDQWMSGSLSQHSRSPGESSIPDKASLFPKGRYIKHPLDSPANQGGTCAAELGGRSLGFRLNQATCRDQPSDTWCPCQVLQDTGIKYVFSCHLVSPPDDPLPPDNLCERFFMKRVMSHLKLQPSEPSFLPSLCQAARFLASFVRSQAWTCGG